MSKKIFLVVLFFIIFAQSVQAGIVSFSARASIYNPPEEGASPSIMYGFGFDYSVNPIVTVRGAAEYTSYTVKGVQYSLMPITLNIIAHFIPYGNFDPYLGAGCGLYSKTVGADETRSLGLQAVAGLKFYIGNFTCAFEANYMIPDCQKSGSGNLSYGGWASGATYVTVPF